MRAKQIIPWALVGLFVPIFSIASNLLLDRSSVGLGWENVMIVLWPSSFLLMALHGEASTVSVLLTYAIAVGTNVIIYSIVGAIAESLRASHFEARAAGHSSQETFKVMAVIYPIYGLGGLFGVPLLLGFSYGPEFLRYLETSSGLNIIPVAGIVNAVASCFIGYVLWKEFPCGRFVTLSYNGIWISLFLVGLVSSYIVGPPSGDPVLLALLPALVFIGFPAWVIAHCLQRNNEKFTQTKT
jgi:hypothetical protein